jgi:hypothetical protein
MAVQAAPTYIADIFLVVMLYHFAFVMAGIAIPFRTSGRMALTAISFRRAMIHRKLVIEICVTPRTGIVAL